MLKRLWAGVRLFFTPIPPHQCSDCGHTFMFEGPPHDNTACEVAKLRREFEAMRAELTGDG